MLPEPMMERLRKTAEEKGIAISEVIRHAIEMFYEVQAKKSL